MSANIIYACKKKLIGIDAVLPLLMELKAQYRDVRILVLFFDAPNQDEIRKNYLIWKALKSLNARLYDLRHPSRQKRYFIWLRILCAMLFSKNILIKNADTIPHHARTVSLLKKITSLVELYAFISGWPLEVHRTVQLTRKVERENLNAEKKQISHDYYISSLPRPLLEEIYDTSVEEDRLLRIGYSRKLPQWTAFMEQEARTLGLDRQPYFVFYVPPMLTARSPGLLDEPTLFELLEEALTVLRRFNSRVKTYFKPHIISDKDLKTFEGLLQRIEYTNYAIDYGHPMVFATEAEFVISVNVTSVIFDAYYLNKPVIVFTQIDKRLDELFEGKCEAGSACDFYIRRDQDALTAVVEKLLSGEITVNHDPAYLAENYPDTPEEFWGFWRRQIQGP